MATNTYILCPGQGAQAVGMGKDLFEAAPAARAVFESANRVLGFDLSSLCFSGPEERLNQTDISQPAIFAASVASFHAARDAGLIDPAGITAFAGLSLGEYTALHLAGTFGFEEGLKLVAARGRYMQEAAVASPSSMVAILGADEAAVEKLCRESAQGEVLVAANLNAPGQIVISGSKGACERALAGAEASGMKATALKVAGAFHSPLMQPAADRMAAELEKVKFNLPAKPVYSNVTAQPHGDVQSIKRRLVEQIVWPVQWERTMRTLVADEGARFVELAPGRTLAGLAKRINRRLPVESVATMEAINTAKSEALAPK
ncbi:MAG TPA: ACP S-malonyltransferase [Humisphaera sp.]|jgi:[acyl-carrier-protein] S-malonyltransferase|nr:ACP S-malonyltransferase [Humisphaera sp.]